MSIRKKYIYAKSRGGTDYIGNLHVICAHGNNAMSTQDMRNTPRYIRELCNVSG